MNLDKLKESARRFEQKEDWRRAIEVYQRALAESEAQGDPVPDPSVYNRVGDLQMKVGEIGGAVRSYEQALELYADQGFFNNAIALGGKILRVDPGRTATHLRLAQLHARKNVVPEVRRHLRDYLERMGREHRLPAAIEAVRGFVERHCRDAEMRAVVADLLAQSSPAGGSREELDQLLDRLHAQAAESGPDSGGAGPGAVRGLVFLDTDPDWTPTGGEERPPSGVEAVEGLTTVEATIPSMIEGLPLIGLESLEFGGGGKLEVEPVAGIELEEASFSAEGLTATPGELTFLETRDADPAEGLIGGAAPLDGLAPTLLDPSLDEPPADPSLSIEVFDRMDGDDLIVLAAEGGSDLEFISVEEGEAPGPPAVEAAQAPSVADLEARLAREEAAEDWGAALGTAAELVWLEPDHLPRYQKQVELAYRAGDRDGLTARYLELGDALLRAGMRAPAVAVFRRVLEHEPGHSRALGALASLGVSVEPLPPAPPAIAPVEPPRSDYVDLGALILDDQPVRDSRMRVDVAEPAAPDDEDQTFREILGQFKRGIEENIDSEDFQAHYDLGIAFKEMGLLDEAIAQFQRALRSPEGRLKASEALGVSFHEKGRHAIAEAVLSRAIEGLPGADDEKIGLIYWLGRSLESQGREGAALPCYERALAVDIRFLDVADRVARLAAVRAS